MASEPEVYTALGDVAARQLANATKTVPQMSRITPRWLTHLLQWVPVEAGIYRLNRVKDESKVTVDCSDRDERVLPQTFVDYESPAREYMLTAVNTVVDVHTRVSDLYSVPYNQISEQFVPRDGCLWLCQQFFQFFGLSQGGKAEACSIFLRDEIAAA